MSIETKIRYQKIDPKLVLFIHTVVPLSVLPDAEKARICKSAR